MLTVMLQNLIKMDRLSKSDPCVTCSLVDKETGTLKQVGQTETIWNDHNPVFETKFQIETYRKQEVVFHVYDMDNDGKVKTDNLIGSLRCQARDLLYHGKKWRLTNSANKDRDTKLFETDSRISFVVDAHTHMHTLTH